MSNEKTLDEIMKLAVKHKMTAEEIRAQRISFVVGMTGASRESVKEWMDRYEGRK